MLSGRGTQLGEGLGCQLELPGEVLPRQGCSATGRQV